MLLFEYKEKFNNFLTELIAPTRCIYCKRFKYLFCPDCEYLLEKYESVCCVCKKESVNFSTHNICSNETYLKSLIVCFKYNDVVQKIIEGLKYKFVAEFAGVIAKLILRNEYAQNLFEDDLIFVPVPLYEKKEKWRGFNQSELIIDEILNKVGDYEKINFYYSDLKLPRFLKMNLLKRVKSTEVQAKLKKEDRIKNVKNAFVFDHSFTNLNKNLKIILVDDVTTTTSTINECAKVLAEAGFYNIHGLVIARG